MPELPDVTVYLEALETRVRGKRLERVRVLNPFLLRTADPPISSIEGKTVTDLLRVGKRIVLELEGDLFLVVHLMIAGRLHWIDKGSEKRGRNVLALFEFENGTLSLTEAGTKRRASVHVVRGDAGLKTLDPGGLDVMRVELAQ